ncbi:WAS/WASL-interacting protein family member 3-like [Dipodomys spectabilis]|uniref:WAS/WASL-interacting protein family member 3-like n=1 Tax=Dipodomys spectabilis TaxID=105255 RepID=UPI001C5412C6|nr:WAS/WASL-interacting protein family member 3-like [Dipodomys spectabilis]
MLSIRRRECPRGGSRRGGCAPICAGRRHPRSDSSSGSAQPAGRRGALGRGAPNPPTPHGPQPPPPPPPPAPVPLGRVIAAAALDPRASPTRGGVGGTPAHPEAGRRDPPRSRRGVASSPRARRGGPDTGPGPPSVPTSLGTRCASQIGSPGHSESPLRVPFGDVSWHVPEGRDTARADLSAQRGGGHRGPGHLDIRGRGPGGADWIRGPIRVPDELALLRVPHHSGSPRVPTPRPSGAPPRISRPARSAPPLALRGLKSRRVELEIPPTPDPSVAAESPRVRGLGDRHPTHARGRTPSAPDPRPSFTCRGNTCDTARTRHPRTPPPAPYADTQGPAGRRPEPRPRLLRPVPSPAPRSQLFGVNPGRARLRPLQAPARQLLTHRLRPAHRALKASATPLEAGPDVSYAQATPPGRPEASNTSATPGGGTRRLAYKQATPPG